MHVIYFSSYLLPAPKIAFIMRYQNGLHIFVFVFFFFSFRRFWKESFGCTLSNFFLLLLLSCINFGHEMK